MDVSSTRCRALVTHAPIDGKAQWTMEDVEVPSVKADELLVRVVASGICHTDFVFASMPEESGMFPIILGHEGLFEEATCRMLTPNTLSRRD
jgi:Zn-dependent alcohol dehydrogenase